MCLVWGNVIFFCFLSSQLHNCFGKIRVVLRSIYESAAVLKKTFYSSGTEKDILEIVAVSLLLLLLLGLGGWTGGLGGFFLRPEMLCALSPPVTETTDGGLKTLVMLMVKCSCLEVPGYYLSTNKYEVCALWAVVTLTPLDFVELVA